MLVSKIFKIAIITIIVVVVVYFSGKQIQLGVDAVGAQELVPAESLYREVINDAFGLGERLKYTIGYGFITAGNSYLEVIDTNTIGDFLCYRIESRTTSNSFFDKFYKVRDTIVSQIDVDGIFSHYFEKSLNEGSYHSRRRIDFQHNFSRAIHTKNDDPPDTLEIGLFSQDVLSMLYYIRIASLADSKSIFMNTVSGGKVQKLEVKVIKREKIDVAAGEFDCIVVEPMLASAGIFKHEGQIKVWLTDDRLRMPVLMKSKVVVGSIYAELEEYRLGDLDW